jgi:hypothetical protein
MDRTTENRSVAQQRIFCNFVRPRNGRSSVAYMLLRCGFTGLLPSNGCLSTVGCALVGKCLAIPFLETAQSVTLLLLSFCIDAVEYSGYFCNHNCLIIIFIVNNNDGITFLLIRRENLDKFRKKIDSVRRVHSEIFKRSSPPRGPALH